MGRRVILIASGETERRALPHLLAGFTSEGVEILEVRIPPRHRDLTSEVAASLIKAIWYDLKPRGFAPDKIVVLVDADDRQAAEKVADIEGPLFRSVEKIPVRVLVTAAKWHLEAWFFADQKGLRGCLGRDLGSVDASLPDAIRNPKHHLKQLLGRPYVAGVAEEIASRLDVAEVRRSPSFRAFEAAIRNGGQETLS